MYARAHDGEVGQDPLVAGGRGDADALLGLDPEGEQPGGEGVDPVARLLPCHRLPRVAIGVAVGLEGGGLGDPVEEQLGEVGGEVFDEVRVGDARHCYSWLAVGRSRATFPT
jgi:hypothetical protein